MPLNLLEVIKFNKKSWFFGRVVRGILLYKILLYFFFKIIYFMKSLAKLVDSNMEFHGFFELWRDTTVAWSVFHFIYLSWMPRTTDAKIDQKHKKIFSFFDLFFLWSKIDYKHFFLWSSLYKDLWRKIPKYQEFPEFQDFWFRFSEKYFRSKFFVTSKSILLDE